MKKIVKRLLLLLGIIIILVAVAILLFNIYYSYSKNNDFCFIEGTYTGYWKDDDGNEIYFELIITAINEETFNESDGVNVVKSFYLNGDELIEEAHYKNLRRYEH
mgnify:CR=1 FL=1|jgi:hypothetical protein